MFAGTSARGRANRDGVLWVYRARRGSGQRSRRRCSTWARTGAHLREERPAATAAAVVFVVVAVALTRGRGRPQADTGSRPAPDIGSSCPVHRSRPVASSLFRLFLSFSLLSFFRTLFLRLFSPSIRRPRTHSLSRSRARNETTTAAAAFPCRTAAPGSPARRVTAYNALTGVRARSPRVACKEKSERAVESTSDRIRVYAGGALTTRHGTVRHSTPRYGTPQHDTVLLRSAPLSVRNKRDEQRRAFLSRSFSPSLSPSFSRRPRSIHLSLVNETHGIRCATHHASVAARDARLALSRNARIRLRACPTQAGGERLAERVSLARGEALDVRPYIKMASRAAWHPLAKPPRPISRTLPPIATTLRRDGIHTAHRFRSPHTSAARALTSDATLYVILRAVTRQSRPRPVRGVSYGFFISAAFLPVPTKILDRTVFLLSKWMRVPPLFRARSVPLSRSLPNRTAVAHGLN